MRIILYITSILLLNLNLYANTFSIFGGSYDYDDDNTSTLYGLNYHLSDNEINVFDVIVVVSHVIGNNILDGVSYYAADMNSDGIINIQDIIFIINLII